MAYLNIVLWNCCQKQCPQYVHILLFHLKFCRFDSKKEINPTQKIFSADNINELIFNLLSIMISILVSTYNIFPSSAIHWTFTSHYRFCYFLAGEHSKKLTGNVLQYNARHKNTNLFVFKLLDLFLKLQHSHWSLNVLK